jgi:hypothetical protein
MWRKNSMNNKSPLSMHLWVWLCPDYYDGQRNRLQFYIRIVNRRTDGQAAAKTIAELPGLMLPGISYVEREKAQG